MGIIYLILLLVSFSHFSFANSTEALLRSELRAHPSLHSIESELFSFLEDIKNPNYQLNSSFTLTNRQENEFETVYFLERKTAAFHWIIDTPSLTGGNCGLTHLQLIGATNKIHYATIYLKDQCQAIGLSYTKNGLIHHVDLEAESIEVVDPNPPVVLTTLSINFTDEDFSNDLTSKVPEVRVCVVDNGFNLSHAGLQGRIARNQNGEMLTLDLTDEDNNTFSESPHGTHVAGIASKNSQKIKIVGVKLTTSDNLRLGNVWRTDLDTHDNVLNELKQALKFCRDNNASIVNLSLTYAESDENDIDEVEKQKNLIWKEEYKAILNLYPDLLFTVAAGNSGKNIDSNTIFPAGLDLPNLITVGAYDNFTDGIWFDEEEHGSNYSASKVDILAPGVLINSFSFDNGFDSYSGTSMASPYVANRLAIIKLQQPNLSNQDLKEALLKMATSKDSLKLKVRNGHILE